MAYELFSIFANFYILYLLNSMLTEIRNRGYLHRVYCIYCGYVFDLQFIFFHIHDLGLFLLYRFFLSLKKFLMYLYFFYLYECSAYIAVYVSHMCLVP